jgi:hypothetical protein
MVREVEKWKLDVEVEKVTLNLIRTSLKLQPTLLEPSQNIAKLSVEPYNHFQRGTTFSCQN